MYNAFNDAPHGENAEPEVWDAKRIRERTGIFVRAGLLRGYAIASSRDATGEMAAISQVIVDPEAPQWDSSSSQPLSGRTAVTGSGCW